MNIIILSVIGFFIGYYSPQIYIYFHNIYYGPNVDILTVCSYHSKLGYIRMKCRLSFKSGESKIVVIQSHTELPDLSYNSLEEVSFKYTGYHFSSLRQLKKELRIKKLNMSDHEINI